MGYLPYQLVQDFSHQQYEVFFNFQNHWLLILTNKTGMGPFTTKTPKGGQKNPMTFFSWCLNQPNWKNMRKSSNFGFHFPKNRGENFQKMFELPPPSSSVINDFFAGSLLLNKRWLNYLWWAEAAWYVQSSLDLIGQNHGTLRGPPSATPPPQKIRPY